MKENEITGLALLVAVAGALGKWDMFQKAGEKFLTRLVEGHYSRRLGRRFTNLEELERLLVQEREELDTLALVVQRQWSADHVTVVEYDCTDELLPPLATCTVEHREPRMAPIKSQMQSVRLEPPAWQEIQRVHCLPSRCLFMPDVRDVENYSLRSQLLRSGVRSAYYQSLPRAAGTCGAMLSMSWTEPKLLSEADLAGIHVLVRSLASVSRAIWAYQPTATA